MLLLPLARSIAEHCRSWERYRAEVGFRYPGWPGLCAPFSGAAPVVRPRGSGRAGQGRAPIGRSGRVSGADWLLRGVSRSPALPRLH